MKLPAHRINCEWITRLTVQEPGKNPLVSDWGAGGKVTLGTGPGVHVRLMDPKVALLHCILCAEDGAVVVEARDGAVQYDEGWRTFGAKARFAGSPGRARFKLGDSWVSASLLLTERPSHPGGSSPGEAKTLFRGSGDGPVSGLRGLPTATLIRALPDDPAPQAHEPAPSSMNSQTVEKQMLMTMLGLVAVLSTITLAGMAGGALVLARELEPWVMQRALRAACAPTHQDSEAQRDFARDDR